jgi:hypothetical protein
MLHFLIYLFKLFLFNLFLKKQIIKTGVNIVIPSFTQTLIVEKDEIGEYYFAINDIVEIPKEMPRTEVKSIGIFWDSSLYIQYIQY